MVVLRVLVASELRYMSTVACTLAGHFFRHESIDTWELGRNGEKSSWVLALSLPGMTPPVGTADTVRVFPLTGLQQAEFAVSPALCTVLYFRSFWAKDVNCVVNSAS
jgi:hypothetical protein